jgi:hypothetical protein
VANLKSMPMPEKIPLLIEAGLMSQEGAVQAKCMPVENGGRADEAGEPERHNQGSGGAG